MIFEAREKASLTTVWNGSDALIVACLFVKGVVAFGCSSDAVEVDTTPFLVAEGLDTVSIGVGRKGRCEDRGGCGLVPRRLLEKAAS